MADALLPDEPLPDEPLPDEPLPDEPLPDEPLPDEKDWTWVLRRRCDECGFSANEVATADLAERMFVAAEEWVQILRSSPAVEVRPAPRVWSPLEYGAHVRDLLGVAITRLQALLTQDDPTFADWDQDETARLKRYADQDPEVVADELEAAAQQLVGDIQAVSDQAWDRPGTRSNGSVFTVTTLLQYVLHDVVHHLWDVTGQQDAAASLSLG